MHKVAEQVLAEVFPNGIAATDFDLARRIADAIDRAMGSEVQPVKAPSSSPVNDTFLAALSRPDGVTTEELRGIIGGGDSAVRTKIQRLRLAGADIQHIPGASEGKAGHVGRPTGKYKMTRGPQR